MGESCLRSIARGVFHSVEISLCSCFPSESRIYAAILDTSVSQVDSGGSLADGLSFGPLLTRSGKWVYFAEDRGGVGSVGTQRGLGSGRLLSQTQRLCSAKKYRPSLRSLLFQAIIVVQPAENRGGSDSVPRRMPMPMVAGRNACLDWLRNART
jgi:hypothetical protein